MRDITAIFNEIADKHRDYSAAWRLVQQNSRGKIWVVGGFVYRSLAAELYTTPPPRCDFDFLVEEREPVLRLPEGWEERRNSHGNPKLISNEYWIDLIPLPRQWYFVKHGIAPSIEGFLEHTPLTIGSIAYDTVDRRILGEIGPKALYDKTVAVHDVEAAAYVAQLKAKTVEQLVQEKAESLGFRAVL